MARKGRALRALVDLVAETYPEVKAAAAITRGLVAVNGRIATNPASLVRRDAPVTIRTGERPLRGEAKLAAALEAFAVRVEGRTALDLGAAAGGFTRVLLRAGARKVYAVDVGFGQLLGSLRQHPAVVNLERTNLADLSRTCVRERVELVTADLSYVSLARAVPQLGGRIAFSPGAELVALVKPQFELGLARPPRSGQALLEAVRAASAGIERAGWDVTCSTPSPVTGRHGAIEFLLHARWRATGAR